MSKKVVLTSGKRKTAIARAVCLAGKGRIRINNVPLEIQQPELARLKMLEPVLIAGDLANNVDINIRVKGGGFMCRADAVRTALAKAFSEAVEVFTDTTLFLAIYSRPALLIFSISCCSVTIYNHQYNFSFLL